MNATYEIIPYGFIFQYALQNDPELHTIREIILTYFPSKKLDFYNQKLQNIKKITIYDLPLECILSVFEYMDCYSLCCSQSVCTMWREPANWDILWRQLCIESFKSSPEEVKFTRSATSKEMYASMHTTIMSIFRGNRQTIKNLIIPRDMLM
mmetsp:Transcript_9983/g.15071  ORF Transcript_9983/g.15071 Transcript_9983/m.15071 type:complete len:152 (+) Transcript_9983:190-645(+)